MSINMYKTKLGQAEAKAIRSRGKFDDLEPSTVEDYSKEFHEVIGDIEFKFKKLIDASNSNIEIAKDLKHKISLVFKDFWLSINKWDSYLEDHSSTSNKLSPKVHNNENLNIISMSDFSKQSEFIQTEIEKYIDTKYIYSNDTENLPDNYLKVNLDDPSKVQEVENKIKELTSKLQSISNKLILPDALLKYDLGTDILDKEMLKEAVKSEYQIELTEENLKNIENGTDFMNFIDNIANSNETALFSEEENNEDALCLSKTLIALKKHCIEELEQYGKVKLNVLTTDLRLFLNHGTFLINKDRYSSSNDKIVLPDGVSGRISILSKLLENINAYNKPDPVLLLGFGSYTVSVLKKEKIEQRILFFRDEYKEISYYSLPNTSFFKDKVLNCSTFKWMRENSVIDYDSALGGIITAEDEKTSKLIQGTNSLQYLLNKPDTFQQEFISHLRSAKTCLNEICIATQVFSKAINSLKEKLSETVTQIDIFNDGFDENTDLALERIDSATQLAEHIVSILNTDIIDNNGGLSQEAKDKMNSLKKELKIE